MDKNKCIKKEIEEIALRYNAKYPGIFNDERIKKIIDMFSNREENITTLNKEMTYMLAKTVKYYVDKNNLKDYSSFKENERERCTCSSLKEAYKIIRAKRTVPYLAGGITPYILLDQESDRLHDDLDMVCDIKDIDKLRNIYKKTPFYNKEYDSKELLDDGDYGFELNINGVPVGIYPFKYDQDSKELLQYSYDPYTKECKIKEMPVEDLNNYITTYKGKDNKEYKTMHLEYIKKSKDLALRPKDIIDSYKIEEFGYDKKLYKNIMMFKQIQNTKVEDLNKGKIKGVVAPFSLVLIIIGMVVVISVALYCYYCL